MVKDKFFDTVIVDNDSITVKGIDKNGLYVKSVCDGTLTICNGSVSIIRSFEYPDYCQVYYNYWEYDSNPNVIEPLKISFYPSYTKDGERIFVKHNKDELRYDFINGVFRPL